MIEIKKTTFLLALLTVLILGLSIGYLLGNSKAPYSKSLLSINNQTNTNNNNNVSANKTVYKTDLTAQEAVDIAYSDALLWADDAYLSGIKLNSKNFNVNGNANGWIVEFYSKEKGKSFEIVTKDGESRGGEEKEVPSPLQTLKGEMIDSSKLANSFYSSYPENTEIIKLKMYYDSEAKKFIWTIFFDKGTHTIDAEI
ncbi:MAG: hypothetical protein P1P85_02015 [Patescibacteria group bacterium]|nr:hypothetical protein [Patescibacteria group bacterium]